jgi:CSLREA domain-containing protein
VRSSTSFVTTIWRKQEHYLCSTTGGGLADVTGQVTVANCTFSGNVAPQGGGLFSSGTLLVHNTILANSGNGTDCVATGTLDAASTHNLIQAHDGCGTPISTAEPRLETLGGYNGPTPTLPLGGGSPAINLGDNAAAVDEHGTPLVWDQRGNGDPRFVAGLTDLGAFEVQAFPVLRVNTVEDTDRRACTGGGAADCSLRGAITLANAMRKRAVITFDPTLFAVPRTIVLTRPLPTVAIDLTLDARGRGAVTVRGDFVGFQTTSDARLTLHGIQREEGK